MSVESKTQEAVRTCYLLVLQGQGDVEAKLVDQETWDWIHSDPERPPDNPSVWEDPNVPEALRARISKERNQGLPEACQERGISISSGSWQNDRAVQAPALSVDEKEMAFWNISEAFKTAKALSLDILDSYHGYIY